MSKKSIIAASIAALAFSLGAKAQNVQLHYDWGHSLYEKSGPNGGTLNSRPKLTSTVEMFRPDSWGSTYFFIDMDYGQKKDAVTGVDINGGVQSAYWEISRELKFWDAPFSAHIEYDGGRGDSIFNDAWLFGATWSWANKDFTKTFSFSAMYKYIPRNTKDVNNFQLTAVWNIWLCNRKFLFSGFVDFWRENRAWQNTDFILLSEPQFWWNLNTLPGWEKINLSVGGEVELSNNFVGKGFYAIPTTAVKWTF